MRILAFIGIEDSGVVEFVDAHLPGGMDDFARTTDHAHMDDSTLLVLEEGQVADLSLGGKVQWLPQLHLLRGVTRNQHTYTLVYQLGETRAVDARRRASTPEIGGSEEAKGKLQHRGQGTGCRLQVAGIS